MEKVKLNTLVHPNPYSVAWLQKGQQVVVTKQCLVNFQTGNLEEKELCDEVQLDLCFFLLCLTESTGQFLDPDTHW